MTVALEGNSNTSLNEGTDGLQSTTTGGNVSTVVSAAVRPQRRKKQFAVSVQWERQQEEDEDPDRRKPLCTGTSEDCYRCCCCARRVGNMFFLWERRDGSPMVVAGPCWPFCVFFTVPLILILSALVAYFVFFADFDGMRRLPSWVAAIYLPIVGITLGSLFFVSCRDPGLLERVVDEEAGQSGWFWNEQVGSYRPPGSLYCRECKVLIKDFDHLCPWTGTGIGSGNMCYFKLFVVMVNLLCYLSIGLSAYLLLSQV